MYGNDNLYITIPIISIGTIIIKHMNTPHIFVFRYGFTLEIKRKRVTEKENVNTQQDRPTST